MKISFSWVTFPGLPVVVIMVVVILVVVALFAGTGVADNTLQVVNPSKSKKTGSMVNLPIIPAIPIPARFVISGVPETSAPGLGRQADSWRSAPHAVVRLALYYGQKTTLEEVAKERLALGIPTLEQLAKNNSKAILVLKTVVDALGKEAVIKQVGTSGVEEKILLKQKFDDAMLKELASLDDLKQLLAQGKPVLVLLAQGSHEDPTLNRLLDKKVKINDYQWVVVFGYDEADHRLHYADPGLEQHQMITYEAMQKRWETTEQGIFLDLDDGFFIRPRTMVWIDKKK